MTDPRDLPSPYNHPPASAEARRIAMSGMVLRAQVGSGVHGTGSIVFEQS